MVPTQGGAAAAIATIFSPARSLFATIDETAPEKVTAPSDLADKTTAAAAPAAELGEDVRRRVKMTKAFTALRDDITTDSSTKPLAATAKFSPTRSSPSKKKKKKKVRASKKTVVPVQRKAISKVKTEPMRRSRRSRGYKKGQYSEATMTKLAWSGQGSRSSPIIC